MELEQIKAEIKVRLNSLIDDSNRLKDLMDMLDRECQHSYEYGSIKGIVAIVDLIENLKPHSWD